MFYFITDSMLKYVLVSLSKIFTTKFIKGHENGYICLVTNLIRHIEDGVGWGFIFALYEVENVSPAEYFWKIMNEF